MKLAALFEESHMLIHAEARDFAQAVEQLVQSVAEHLGPNDPGELAREMVEAELALPLPPGHGVRIPHRRLPGVGRLVLALATSEEGWCVSEESDERVHLVFLILTPRNQSTVMLQAMSSIARFVQKEANRQALVSTRSPGRALRIMEESGIEVKKAILASDLMNAPAPSVSPEASLRQVVEGLVRCGEEGLAVVDDEDRLVGDISTRLVIEVGLPRYMNLMSNPSMLSEFEPFEAFYHREDSMRAEEIMNRDFVRLEPDTPVEIVAHEMITKQCERAYVVAEEALVGVVYRKDIVRKVLYL